MLLTRECEYALRILRELKDEEMKMIKSVSKSQHIPQKFVYKIVAKLQKAGILQTRRGSEGGCQLAKPLAEISLYDVVHAVDARTVYVCVKAHIDCPHNHNGDCRIHHGFQELQYMISNHMRTKTIREIV